MAEFIELKEEDLPKDRLSLVEIAHRLNQYSFLILSWLGIILGLGSESNFFFTLTLIISLLYFGSMIVVAYYLIEKQKQR